MLIFPLFRNCFFSSFVHERLRAVIGCCSMATCSMVSCSIYSYLILLSISKHDFVLLSACLCWLCLLPVSTHSFTGKGRHLWDLIDWSHVEVLPLPYGRIFLSVSSQTDMSPDMSVKAWIDAKFNSKGMSKIYPKQGRSKRQRIRDFWTLKIAGSTLMEKITGCILLFRKKAKLFPAF